MKILHSSVTITDGEEELTIDFVVEAETIEEAANLVAAALGIDF